MNAIAYRLGLLQKSLEFDEHMYGNNKARSTLDFPEAIRIVSDALRTHDELVAALRKLVNAIDRMPSNAADGLADEARAALAKVE